MRGQSPFHAGELAVQERVGVHERAERSAAHSIRDHLIEQHRDFYTLLPMLFIGFVDADGKPWASILTGTPGFSHALDERRLRINALPLPGDPLAAVLRDGLSVGCLGLQWETRRRNRVNGLVSDIDGDGFTLDVIHAFGNCPKYIQKREVVAALEPGAALLETRTVLNADDTALIARAYTFCIATAVADGADVSHRGGKAGFLRLEEEGALSWPDYTGNNFFNTLGNIEANSAAGLLIPDWETGRVLQMTGSAEIRWDVEARAGLPGAKRVMAFKPTQVRSLSNIIPDRWALIESSPFLDRLKD